MEISRKNSYSQLSIKFEASTISYIQNDESEIKYTTIDGAEYAILGCFLSWYERIEKFCILLILLYKSLYFIHILTSHKGILLLPVLIIIVNGFSKRALLNIITILIISIFFSYHLKLQFSVNHIKRREKV